jgi:hypothetical protein
LRKAEKSTRRQVLSALSGPNEASGASGRVSGSAVDFKQAPKPEYGKAEVAKQYQSSPVFLLGWIVLDSVFDVSILPLFAGRPAFYWMFVGVIMFVSFGASIEFEHALHLAGWQDPLVRLWHRARSPRLDAIAGLHVTDEQLRRYCEFVDRIRSDCAAGMDLDGNIELELSHFQDDGTLVVNAYPKTTMGEAMIGMVTARLERWSSI